MNRFQYISWIVSALAVVMPGLLLAQSGIQSIDAPSFQRQLDADPQAILLDVRTDQEYRDGHLADAVHIDILQPGFEDKIRDLNITGPVYVYCKVGGRSMQAARILRQMGFTQIYDLSGGILAWQAHGLPTE